MLNYVKNADTLVVFKEILELNKNNKDKSWQNHGRQLKRLLEV
jgi:hypothetical protein